MQNFSLILFLALFLWLTGLSIAFYYLLRHYKKLSTGVKSGNLIQILDKVLREQKKTNSDVSDLGKSLKFLELDVKNHIQKFGLIRFNPFNETGGDQSFSLSLLDKNDNGFVITCLHTRDRTRVYAKPVNKGKSEYDLSKEEQKAIQQAK